MNKGRKRELWNTYAMETAGGRRPKKKVKSRENKRRKQERYNRRTNESAS